MRTTALHQGLLLGQIAPACNMSFTPQQGRWDAPELLLKRLIISHLDTMFDLASAPEFIVLEGEDIMVFPQQFAGVLCFLHRPFIQASEVWSGY